MRASPRTTGTPFSLTRFALNIERTKVVIANAARPSGAGSATLKPTGADARASVPAVGSRWIGAVAAIADSFDRNASEVRHHSGTLLVPYVTYLPRHALANRCPPGAEPRVRLRTLRDPAPLRRGPAQPRPRLRRRLRAEADGEGCVGALGAGAASPPPAATAAGVPARPPRAPRSACICARLGQGRA